jgi:hypothetical protein
MKRIFKYIEPLWQGADGKISVRSALAIAFSIDFIHNLSHAIFKWDGGRTLEGLSLVLGIEAGLIVALLGLTTYQNMAAQKIDSLAANPTAPAITIEKVENVNTATNTTTAKTVNAAQVDTVNTTNTNITSKVQIDNPDGQ